MKRATIQEIQGFRTSLAGVASLLGLNYRTITPWTRWFKLAGRRGRQRYGNAQLVKFRIVSHLLERGFSIREVNAALDEILPWMVKQDDGHNSLFIVKPCGNDEVECFQFLTPERFAVAATALTKGGVPFCPIDLAGIAQEINERVECHLNREKFVSYGERVLQGLREIAAQNRAADRPENSIPGKAGK